MSRQKTLPRHGRLRRLESFYGKLARSLGGIGYIFPGSIATRFMPCGKPYCRCATDSSKRHGPYYEWTRKLAGKTVSVRLTAEQARLYKGWIGNRRQLKKILTRMEAVSVQIAEVQPVASHRHRQGLGPLRNAENCKRA